MLLEAFIKVGCSILGSQQWISYLLYYRFQLKLSIIYHLPFHGGGDLK